MVIYYQLSVYGKIKFNIHRSFENMREKRNRYIYKEVITCLTYNINMYIIKSLLIMLFTLDSS